MLLRLGKNLVIAFFFTYREYGIIIVKSLQTKCNAVRPEMKNSQNQRRIYIFSLIMLSESTLGCGIFVFCLLLFPQNERKIYKLRQLSLFQFVYFLREVCLVFNFGMMKVNFINQKLKSKHTSPKNIQTKTIYVVSVCIFFSRFVGMRGDKN